MRRIKIIFSLFILVALMGSFGSMAIQGQDDPSIRDLKEKIEALEAQEDPGIRNLRERIETLEEQVMSSPPETGVTLDPEKKAELYHTLFEKKFLEDGIEIVPGVVLSGLLEVEANYETLKKDEGDYEHNSDITLATFELGLNVNVIKYLHGHALLLWEEDGTEPIDLDEGIITLGLEEDFPYFLSAGKLYVPFGVFESHMISNPLTLELGETRESAVLIGMEHDLFVVSAGAFKGDIQKVDRGSRINNLVAGIDFTPIEGLVAGISYITDIADSEGLTELVPEGRLGKLVGGISAYFVFEIGPITLNGEYLGALDKFEDIPVPAGEETDLEGMEPKAWNFEAAYLFEDLDWEVGIRYEGSNDFPDGPIGQGGICLSWGVLPNTTLATEYLYGEFKNNDKRNLTTAQLAFEF